MARSRTAILAELGSRPTIDVEEELARRRDFLVAYLEASRTRGFVLAVSGGQDSTLAGKLCQLAAEQARGQGLDATLTTVRLPYGVQADEDDAQEALRFIGPDVVRTVNIKASVDALAADYERAIGAPLSDFAKGNAKARIRMVVQYAIASESGALVVGTDHAAEAITGFFTKFGDGGTDVIPLSGLTKNQGASMLEHLGAPERLYTKAPTADLLDLRPGQTDEDNLGIAYRDIDAYLQGAQVDGATTARIEEQFQKTEHKRRLPVTPFDTWWREH
ncbi:ammonia-dependent NAD(+) synthetase [Amnibacterium sp.]|uniref:ammonia-dependent NAD(+) synthetase n=1 Tax=Amnibacterium sp. TaxID=1872496 RepID=UPI002616B227|nr:ammonia-dependent NAD(+) synthetase [Amnibacterium sp.]MCU1474378.1 ammonia-dependent synthetase [Amnibacterium sp.]